jgi:hypothetical protein
VFTSLEFEGYKLVANGWRIQPSHFNRQIHQVLHDQTIASDEEDYTAGRGVLGLVSHVAGAALCSRGI